MTHISSQFQDSCHDLWFIVTETRHQTGADKFTVVQATLLRGEKEVREKSKREERAVEIQV